MRILLVEDHQLLRQGIVECLNREFVNSIFGEADSIREAIVQMDSAWDVVLLDLALADGSGFGLIARAKRVSPRAKVIILTASTEVDCGLPALREGADGFVMKTARFSDLAKAIRAVTEGRRYFSQSLVERVLNATSHGEKIKSKFSARELDTLRLTAEGLSTGEIGHSLNISVKTVETYRTRICQKLEIRGFASFVRFAILSHSHGYAGISSVPSDTPSLL
jgi:DNA-binding NarL/FixJ family response regulator